MTYTHPHDIDLDDALAKIFGPDLIGGEWNTAINRMADEIRRLRMQRSELAAALKQIGALHKPEHVVWSGEDLAPHDGMAPDGGRTWCKAGCRGDWPCATSTAVAAGFTASTQAGGEE